MINRRTLALASLILLAGCSQSDREASDQSPKAFDAQEEQPNVSPTAAPGVAWRYEYQFQLPDEAISRVQEAHAAQCESMGISQCRITGLNYSVSDNDLVSAMLEVKLAPDLARQYGKQATAEVAKADGRLQSTEFTGEDTEPASSSIARTQSDVSQQITDVERQLANPGLKSAERAQLQAQLSDLRSQLSAAKETLTQVQQKLASTPMRFYYYGKGGISGFAGRDPVMDAARSFVSSLVTMVTVVLQVLAVVLPWALLLFLLFLLWRSPLGRVVRRFFAARTEPADES